MASLVTLGAAPYNPYNTSFAGIAMQGLGMAQNEMNQRDQLAQASYQNYMKSVQFGADLLFKGQEMQLAKRKMDFMVDQSMFERKMAVEDQAFKKEQFSEQKRQFNVGAGFEGGRLQLAQDDYNLRKTIYDDAAPVRDLGVTEKAIDVAGKAFNLQNAPDDRALGVRTREIQNATAIANTAIGFQNSDVAAANAETNAQTAQNRAKQLEQYDKQKAAAIRAYDSQIKQKDDQVTKAEREVIRQTADKKGAKNSPDTPAIKRAKDEAVRLRTELDNLKSEKYRYETQGGGVSSSSPIAPTTTDEQQQQEEDERLYRRRHGLDSGKRPFSVGQSIYTDPLD